MKPIKSARLDMVIARLKTLARHDGRVLQAAVVNAVLAVYSESPQNQRSGVASA